MLMRLDRFQKPPVRKKNGELCWVFGFCPQHHVHDFMIYPYPVILSAHLLLFQNSYLGALGFDSQIPPLGQWILHIRVALILEMTGGDSVCD